MFVFTLLDVRVQWHLLVGKAVIYVLCTEFTKLINLRLEFSSLEFRHCILACKQEFSLNLRGIQIFDSKDRISTVSLHRIAIFLFSIWNPLNFLFLSHWHKRHEVPLLKTKNSSSNLTSSFRFHRYFSRTWLLFLCWVFSSQRITTCRGTKIT